MANILSNFVQNIGRQAIAIKINMHKGSSAVSRQRFLAHFVSDSFRNIRSLHAVLFTPSIFRSALAYINVSLNGISLLKLWATALLLWKSVTKQGLSSETVPTLWKFYLLWQTYYKLGVTTVDNSFGFWIEILCVRVFKIRISTVQHFYLIGALNLTTLLIDAQIFLLD